MSKEKEPKEPGCLLLWSYRDGRRNTSTMKNEIRSFQLKMDLVEDAMTDLAQKTDVGV